MPDEAENPAGEDATNFFRRFERASRELDIAELTDCFAESFVAGDAASSSVVPRAGFLSALPRRAAMAADAGLAPAVLESVQAEDLDEHWVLARTRWRADRAGGDALTMLSSYLVHRTGEGLRIVAYLNHQGLPLRTTG